ncbi:hypothetical protein SCP_0504100 [Sparassis crispa]|uniref:Uncharacterized protein n=1 Tax=Sparassis crispa TaxID=139825 RepID=A0A401GME7_9APHY|nr:hypothetical protein SCP_0504100 [Sparassis crispa]GBE83362.1 hypothetical protein SCP_0504100 [Sparassis crispa]
MDPQHLQQLPGAAACLLEAQMVCFQEVVDEQIEEQESMEQAMDVDNRLDADSHYLREPDPVHKKQKLSASKENLVENLKKASAHVIVENTQNEYRRNWTQFTEFCAELGYVEEPKDVDNLYPNIPSDFPTWIAIWIMNKADELDVRTGKPKDPSVARVTYGTAQKMRAAISHKFGRHYGLGTQQWIENPLKPGEYIGNPSLSVTVSQYMVSLRRRKIRGGEIVTSARAIDQEMMRMLWAFNIEFPQEQYAPVS